ncbi:uncharacterized protein [Parasteatoda tepidariorum]|uniref:uncharacterized protein n=1 Tax=Parasteatoda tepidariorum TaxID=114398 RepID=UPI001C71BB42|nr:putative glucose-6-phosphate 1-epimerase [Parasteatoda tepidariorum]
MSDKSEEMITIKKGNSSATIYLYGATLTSWKPFGKEVLFVSKNSKLDGQKPIRGGVPVIFPQFGPWECGPQHGFARRSKWCVKENEQETDRVTFILKDSEASRAMWNHKFVFEYTLILTSESDLKMEAMITNSGDVSFNFTFLLHTYFSTPDVFNCKVIGLQGCTYIDKTNDGSSEKEENEQVVLSGFTDRIYQNTPLTNKLQNVSGGQNVEIQKVNLPDTVVWNPWIENAKKMDDFGDDEWKNMICVEAGYVSNPFSLEPGKSFRASQTLKIFS